MKRFVVAYMDVGEGSISQESFLDINENYAKIRMLISKGWDVDITTNLEELADMFITAMEVPLSESDKQFFKDEACRC